MANTMPANMDTTQVRKDTTSNTAHIRSIMVLNDVLKSNLGNGLNYSYSYYKNDNHNSVPLIATYDALRFLFKSYALSANQSAELYNPASKANVSTLLAARYQELSNQFGYQVLPPEGMVNELAYYHLQNGGDSNAYALFALNIKNYPTSANAFDSMGDYYNFKKEKKKAIEYYNKTLKLYDNPDTREKLKNLQDKK
ncbi:hypothetical protein HH214_02190 [Mucilaginibacter robiniae]|uniref:Tetratricopeptide repeat protein n=1 Tax=Mucilaginibacter robiniae TaxID=2728022 RepID=A0A7L5DWZ1_9SPHI|nr:hypothetical protein [Mucilaginibacter robiniae]QJD94768.1 hypothetical protein HH214_02190 [Mucilaginibacter robiniae]